MISSKQISALHKQAKDNNADFPLKVELNIGKELIVGTLYENGQFKEGETNPG